MTTDQDFNAFRKHAILDGLDTTGRGIEVAPYFNPFLDKDELNVVYTDYLSTEDLRAKAAENPGAVGKVVPEIDFVWKPGATLAQRMGSNERFDFAVASHVVEHVPNTIGWINEILEVMKVGGKLALAVPNRRDSFDFYRSETTLSELVGNHIEDRRIPSPSQVFDFMSRCVEDTKERQRLFGEGIPFDEAKRPYADDEALRTAIWTHNEKSYLDVHCTVWTELSFVETFRAVNALGLMNVEISEPIITRDFEFVVHFKKLGEPLIVVEKRLEVSSVGVGSDLVHARRAFAEASANCERISKEYDRVKRSSIRYWLDRALRR